MLNVSTKQGLLTKFQDAFNKPLVFIQVFHDVQAFSHENVSTHTEGNHKIHKIHLITLESVRTLPSETDKPAYYK
jgi:hypothetical protein